MCPPRPPFAIASYYYLVGSSDFLVNPALITFEDIWGGGVTSRGAPGKTLMVDCRVTPAHDWRERRVAPEVWLLCQRDLGETPDTKYYLVNLPITASLKSLVRLTHQRWAIEQQYQELKTELGLDHFGGRSYPGWHRHVALAALAYAFRQQERLRRGRPARGSCSAL